MPFTKNSLTIIERELMMMKYLQIIKDGPIATVTINRPDYMNALSIDVLKELCSLNDYFKEDLKTRVVIFTGQGDNFSAGADLKEKTKPTTKLESWRNNHGKPAIKSILEIDHVRQPCGHHGYQHRHSTHPWFVPQPHDHRAAG